MNRVYRRPPATRMSARMAVELERRIKSTRVSDHTDGPIQDCPACNPDLLSSVMPMTPLQGDSLRQPTKYDLMLSHLAEMLAAAAGQGDISPAILGAAALYDSMNTMAGADLLNGLAVAYPAGAMSLALELYVWKVENGARPSWLSSIADSDLASLSQAT